MIITLSMYNPYDDPQIFAADRQLRRNLGQVFKRARDGSTSALRALALSCEDIPALQTRSAIDMFCAGLDVSNIPHSLLEQEEPNLSALSALSRAVSGLVAISTLDVLFPSTESPLLSPLADIWDGIFQWTAFIDGLYPVLAEEEKIPLYKIIADAMLALDLYEPIDERIQNTNGLLELVASIWARKPSAASVDHCSVARLLIGEPDDGAMARFMHAAGITPGSIARLALSRLRASTSSGPGEGSPHVHMLAWMAHGEVGILRQAVLRQHGAAALTKSLLAFAKRPDICSEDYFSIIEINVDALRLYLTTPNAMSSALRNGLLQAYTALSHAMKTYDEELQADILSLLKTTLPPTLVYRSVITQMANSMHTLDPSLGRPTDTNGLLTNALLPAGRLLQERAQFKNNWDAAKHMAFCDSCTTHVDRVTLKTCARCHSPRYCSKACQTRAWPEHKKTCSLRRQMAASLARDGRTSKADRVFIHRLALHDVRKAREELMSRTREDSELYKYPLSKVGVIVAYNKGPPSFLLFHIGENDIRSGSHDESAGLQLTHGVAQEARALTMSTQHGTLIECHTALGMSVMTDTLLVSPSIWNPKHVDDEDWAFRVVDAAWVDRPSCRDDDSDADTDSGWSTVTE
ncbi:hypothetical protein FA95DRAFT_1563842 [Auriscalpium vulgare]|uniref:Uncharacterized protein n=1 Tax=Auriscalpium vulgare TaxID=40419 RepID=A0ACB8RG65_9AGAM|nr:hypothetical protein FA95DRAFT_1563842 [Auriscalpium vulgare]